MLLAALEMPEQDRLPAKKNNKNKKIDGTKANHGGLQV